MKQMKKKYNQKGITLIALIVTIIIMVLLSVGIIMYFFPMDKVSRTTKLYTIEHERSTLALIVGDEFFEKKGNVDTEDLKTKFEEADHIVKKVRHGSEANTLIVQTITDNFFKYINGEIVDFNIEDEEIPVATGNITFGSPSWKDGEATVDLNTSSEYTVQYQVNSTTGTWQVGNKVTGLKHNDVINVRLWNGATAGSYASYSVLDSIEPTVEVTLTKTTNGITAKVVAQDNEYGMDDVPSYTYKIVGGETNKTITQTGASYTFTGLKQTTSYTVTVEVADKAGNIGSGSASETTGTVTPGEGNITFGSPSWKDGEATVELSTTSEYTIQYQVNSTSGKWEDGTTVTGLKNNDTINARLWDGTNGGSYASYTVLDSTAPTQPSIEISNKSLNSGYSYYNGAVLVKITEGSDEESGIEEVTYEVSGKSTVKETPIKSGETFELKEDGTYTVKAYSKNGAGVKSEPAEKTISVCISHDNETTTTTGATCTGVGVTSTVCKNCGNSSSGSIAALGHITPTTYTTDTSQHWKVCGRAGCGAIVEAKANHSGGTATCTAKATCSTCKISYGSTAAHSYTAQSATSTYLKSNATCTSAAVYYYKCANCTAKGTTTFTSGDKNASNHSGSASYSGCTYYKYSCCGKSGGYTSHDYSWTTVGGSGHYQICSRNSTHRTDTVSHTYAWKSSGSSGHTYSCTVCGYSSTGGNHGYTSKITKSATCSSTGTRTYTCSTCGYSYTETIAKKSHSYSAATCTSPKKCSSCGATSGSALGHNYTSYASGLKKCTRCGAITGA